MLLLFLLPPVFLSSPTASFKRRELLNLSSVSEHLPLCCMFYLTLLSFNISSIFLGLLGFLLGFLSLFFPDYLVLKFLSVCSVFSFILWYGNSPLCRGAGEALEIVFHGVEQTHGLDCIPFL